SLGEDHAVIVGHGLGGWVAWATAYLHPSVCRALVTVSMPHPRVLRRAMVSNPRQLLAGRSLVGVQTPFVPAREMVRSGYVEQRLRSGAGWALDPGRREPFPCPLEVQRYSAALAQPFVAACATDHFRWLVRSQLRSSGHQLAAALKGRLPLDVLALQG